MNTNLKSLDLEAVDKNELDLLRQEITDLDQQIASLIETRLEIASQIGKIKEKAGLSIKDETRELEVLQSVSESVHRQENRKSLAKIYRRIIVECRHLQNNDFASRRPSASVVRTSEVPPHRVPDA
ncbi:MAG: chorismate mutase [Candidatus Obscuribacterales bacterium]|nr:chorismate mutase [Candidatus Obscuribacterales bacterium]